MEKARETLKRNVHTEQMILDEWRLRTSTYKEAVDITLSFFHDKYNTFELKRLKDGLNQIEIKGNPQLSINRLVSGIEDAKTLSKLKSKITETEKEYLTLTRNLDAAKGKLKSIEGATLNAIEEVRKNALDAINNTKGSGLESIKELSRTLKTDYGNSIKLVKERINWFGQEINSQTKKSTTGIQKQTEYSLKQFREETEKWGKLQSKIGKNTKLMRYSNQLLGILTLPEAIKELPTSLIAQLLGRIHLWMKLKIPDMKATPSKYLCSEDQNLNHFYNNYALHVLAEFLTEEMKNKAIREASGVEP